MGNFQLPKTTALDTDGVSLPGAKLYFYEAGTTTLLTVYQDKANATPHANPVVADASGRFAPIWLQTGELYKAVLTTSADVTVWTVDNIYPLQVINSTDEDRLKQAASNPLDYGALGDGVANEASAVQSAINASTGTIDLLGKTYRCDSALTIPAGRRLINGKLDFTNCSAAALLSVSGGSLGSAINASSDISVGDTTLTLSSTSALAAGDYVLISSSTGTWTSGTSNGEINRIRSVDSATVVTLEMRSRGAYTTATGAYVKKITTADNVAFQDLRIIAAQVTTQRGIVADYCDNLRMTNVHVQGVNTSGIKLGTCVNTVIDQCSVRGGTTQCIEIADGSFGVTVSNSLLNKGLYGVYVSSTSYVQRQVRLSNLTIYGARTASVFFGDATAECHVTNCSITGTHDAGCDGIVANGDGVTISDNTIRNVLRHGVSLAPGRNTGYTSSASATPASKADRVTIRCTGNTIEHPGDRGISFVPPSTGEAVRGVHLCGNTIIGCGGEGVYVSGANKSVSHLKIDHNTIDSPTKNGILVEGFASGASTTLSIYSISGNDVTMSTTAYDGIKVTGAGTSQVSSGRMDGNRVYSGQRGIYLEDVGTTQLRGNTCTQALNAAVRANYATVGEFFDLVIADTVANGCGYGVYVDADSSTLTNLVVSNAVAKDPTLDGVQVICGSGALRNVAIRDAQVYSPARYGVMTTQDSTGSIDGLCVSGCNVHQPANVGVYLYQASAVTLRNVRVTGNAIHEGQSYGIDISGATRCVVADNTVNLSGGASTVAVSVASSSDVSVRGNACTGTYLVGVNLANCNRAVADGNTATGCSIGVQYVSNTATDYAGASITANVVDSPSSNGVSVSASSSGDAAHITISGNVIKGSGSYGIVLDSSGTGTISAVTIGGNMVGGGSDSAVRVSAGAGAAVTDVQVGSNRLSVQGAVPVVALAGAGTVASAFILGNSFEGGNYSVNNTVSGSSSNIVVGSNVCEAFSVAATNGTYDYAGAISDANAVSGDADAGNPNMRNLANITL